MGFWAFITKLNEHCVLIGCYVMKWEGLYEPINLGPEFLRPMP
jgi:hypothetical protein